MRAKEKHKHTKNDKEKGTGITKYTGQKNINEGHSIERVWHSASREPSDTLPGSQVRIFIFLARRIQPFLSLVDREVEFCLLTI